MFFGLLFELSHAASFAKVSKTVENPSELAVGRHVALAINVYIWVIYVKAGRNIVFDALDYLRIEFVVIDWSSKAM